MTSISYHLLHCINCHILSTFCNPNLFASFIHLFCSLFLMGRAMVGLWVMRFDLGCGELRWAIFGLIVFLYESCFLLISLYCLFGVELLTVFLLFMIFFYPIWVRLFLLSISVWSLKKFFRRNLYSFHEEFMHTSSLSIIFMQQSFIFRFISAKTYSPKQANLSGY